MSRRVQPQQPVHQGRAEASEADYGWVRAVAGRLRQADLAYPADQRQSRAARSTQPGACGGEPDPFTAAALIERKPASWRHPASGRNSFALRSALSLPSSSAAKAVLLTLAVLLAAAPRLTARPAVIDLAGVQPTDVAISEVFYGSQVGDWVELVNTGPSPIDVASWWFCSRLLYTQIGLQTILAGDDYVLQPGERLVLEAGIDLDDVAADLAIYTAFDFENPKAMVDFLQWGTALNVGRADVAADKGVWTEFPGPPPTYDFIATAGAGESTAWCGGNGGGGLLTLSSDFASGPPSLGGPNDAVCALIFADGFESGDLAAWDGAVP